MSEYISITVRISHLDVSKSIIIVAWCVRFYGSEVSQRITDNSGLWNWVNRVSSTGYVLSLLNFTAIYWILKCMTFIPPNVNEKWKIICVFAAKFRSAPKSKGVSSLVYVGPKRPSSFPIIQQTNKPNLKHKVLVRGKNNQVFQTYVTLIWSCVDPVQATHDYGLILWNRTALTRLFIVRSVKPGGHGKELGWPVYCITSLTLPPSQSWQLHYCYWPLLFLLPLQLNQLKQYNSRWGAATPPINVCLRTICNNQMDVEMFTPASWLRSILDLNLCLQMAQSWALITLQDWSAEYHVLFCFFLLNQQLQRGCVARSPQRSSTGLVWLQQRKTSLLWGSGAVSSLQREILHN